MSELAPRPSALLAERENADRTLGALVYGLYLAAPLTLGLSGLLGAVVAAKRRDQAGSVAASHFRFQLWTFGAAAFAVAAGRLWVLLGGAGSMAVGGGDGAWLALAGAALSGSAVVGYLAASAWGLSRLLSRLPIGRLFNR